MLLNKMQGGASDQAAGPYVVPAPPIEDVQVPIERSVYAPPASSRIIGLGGTVAVYTAVVAGFFITISHVVAIKPPSALTVVNLRPEASSPETPPQEKEMPKPVEQKDQPDLPRVQPVERTIVPVAPVSVPLPVVQPKPADPGPVEPETAAPRSMPVPLAPQASSNVLDTWEGRVLAALNKERRYPRLAMMRRQQGVPYVRFTMDRQGKVLSSRLERSSGFPDLDREAVALPRRAEPLPSPPDDKPGDTLELVVPVQFFLK